MATRLPPRVRGQDLAPAGARSWGTFPITVGLAVPHLGQGGAHGPAREAASQETPAACSLTFQSPSPHLMRMVTQ